MTQYLLYIYTGTGSGNETNNAYYFTISTESQCVTSVMQVTIALSVLNAKIASAVGRERCQSSSQNQP